MRLLLVEDNSAVASIFEGMLPKGGQRPEYEHCRDPGSARQRLSKGAYDVVFIDLALGDNDKAGLRYEGLILAQQASQLAPGAIVVLYSEHIEVGKEAEFPLFTTCKAAAEDVIAKERLFAMAPKDFEAWLMQLQRRSEERAATVRVDVAPEDWQTLALRDVVGRSTLAMLLRDAIGSSGPFRLRALSGGLSGALVVRVGSGSVVNGVDEVSHVLKLDREGDALARELARAPHAGGAFDVIGLVPSAQLFQREQWFAIATGTARKVVQLAEFVRDAPSTATRTRATIRAVVDTCLCEPAALARRADGESGQYSLGVPAGWAILSSLEEMGKLKWLVRAADRSRAVRLRGVVEAALRGYWTFSSGAHFTARLHGDMHSRNILIQHGTRPVIIDFGRAGMYPRLFDFGALHADLLVSCLDCLDGRDHDSARIAGWYGLATSLPPFVEWGGIGRSGARTTLHALLVELCRSVGRLESVTPREYAEVLLFQFLRYLRFPNVPIAKRVLCVQLANDLADLLKLTPSGGAKRRARPRR